MLTLLVLQGPDKGRRFELPDAPALVGRDSKQMPITDNTVSRRHCELVPVEDGNWMLKDMGSSNGCYVNGTRVTRTYLLKLGDQIRVGRTIMVFGAQPGVSRLGDGERGPGRDKKRAWTARSMHTIASNEDSMVLAVPEPAAAAMQNLKILYRLGASLGRSFDTAQVLEVVMDLIFEHIKADNGIILLLDAKGKKPGAQVVRTRTSDNGDGNGEKGQSKGRPGSEKIHASRTIINHVIANGAGVLSSNAMADKRFSKGKSVHNLGIRSALCVPIKARRFDGKEGDETLGVIYIDSSVKNYTYSADQLRLLTAIGLQAGLAIQNAKLYQSGLQAERLAAIGETTAALSHSTKNILQALYAAERMSSEMGLRANNLTQVDPRVWRIVNRNLEKIYNLTLNLLAYSKEREPKLEMVNPKVLVEECVELVAKSANDKGIMVVADVEKDHPAVPMDPDGMHQVLMNLLSNAAGRGWSRNGGLIRIVSAGTIRPTNESVIEVIDNGKRHPAYDDRPICSSCFTRPREPAAPGWGWRWPRRSWRNMRGRFRFRAGRGKGRF